MSTALLIDLWFTLTGVAAVVMTAAHLVATVVQLRKNP